MSQTAALIADQLAGWGFMPAVVGVVFERPEPEHIAVALDSFCERSFGASIERAEFFRASVGSVYGLQLSDARRVVVKAHRPGTSVDFRVAMQTVQASLAEAGFPCPRPLVAPTPIGRGVAVAESLIDRGGRADAHDPAIRRELAGSLASLVERCRALTRLDALRQHSMERLPGRLWPQPHDGRFDFEATSAGAQWIDAIALAARRVLDDSPTGEPVVGHADWRVGNMRFADGKVSAVYDWDSLRIMREPELAGSVAHLFTADFGVPNQRRYPTLAEALAFAADYETARGAAFTDAEQRAVRAALAYSMGYTARCEHSDRSTDYGRHGPTPPEASPLPAGGARAFLAAHAADLLDAPVGELAAIEPARGGSPAAGRLVTNERAQEVEALIERLTRWAGQRRDVRAVALVGSWAYGTPSGDSDVDFVLLTDSPSSYIDRDDWLAGVGDVRLVHTADWGAITERRFALPSGLEVELGVGRPAWASVSPVDDGTRRVVSDGMRVLYDPEGLLATLAASCGPA